MKLRELERRMLRSLGEYNKAVDNAEDAGLVAAVVSMFAYIAVMAILGMRHTFPVAESVIVKALAFYGIMLGAAAVACGIGIAVHYICAKYVYEVSTRYDEYLESRRELRHEQRKEEEET